MLTELQKENISRELTRDDIKKALKEALREWLDCQFTRFGRFSFYGLLSAGLVALVYFILIMQGWHPKQ